MELLRAFRRSYESLGLDGHIIATDVDPLAPTLHMVDLSFVVPRVDSPEYAPMLVEICRRENVDAVFPLIDPDIEALDACRALGKKIGQALS